MIEVASRYGQLDGRKPSGCFSLCGVERHLFRHGCANASMPEAASKEEDGCLVDHVFMPMFSA